MDGLCETLESRYDIILRGVPLYSKKRRCIAEIDILAINGKYHDIYEVKCSHRIVKARKQLQKIKKILSSSTMVRDTFFYCGSSDKLIKM